MNFLPLALNTLRETIRDKVLYVILIFALMMISSGVLLSYLSMGEQSKVVMDLGLSSISVFGLVITIFVGTSLVSKEIDKKTIYLLISKPIRRADFILGKYIGLCFTLFIIVLAMSAAFYAVLWFTLGGEDFITWVPTTAQTLVLIYIEMMLLTAFAILFSTFATPVMSAMFTLAIYLIGHMSNDIVAFGKLTERKIVELLTQGLFYVVPDLERLNLKNLALNETVGSEIFGASIGYGLLYILGLLLLSMAIFEGREF